MGKKRRSGFGSVIKVLVVIFVAYIAWQIGFWAYVKIVNWQRLSEIEEVNPKVAAKFRSFISDIETKTDWNVLIISGLRSREKQLALKRENPKNGSVEKSRHVMGRAIDINLYKRSGLGRKWLKKFSSKSSWQETGVVKIANKYHLLWGGTYRNYHDPVHFEVH